MMKHRMMIGAALICTTVAAVNLAQRGDAQTGGGFAGEYGGTSDGGKAVATIRQTSPGNYTIDHTIYGSPSGCGGSVRGAASASGNVMELRIPVLERMETCVMTYRKNGTRLTVSEKSCGYFHGRSCAFDGTLVRKAVGRSQQGALKPRTTTDEPLVGMMEDGGPARGALVTPQGRPKVSSFSDEWYSADDFVAIDDSSDLGLSLTALCYGSPLKPMMGIDPTILIRGFRAPDPEAFSTRERLRLFMTLEVIPNGTNENIACVAHYRLGNPRIAVGLRDQRNSAAQAAQDAQQQAETEDAKIGGQLPDL
ncbi:hypothetical protein WG908_03450 [Sphingobium sp. AN641]|uniref:hypothetical protein n=1 Tax=Sphingobium sp. AN641 TaxID=3133443 RepID=UPI0030BF8701